MIETTHTRFIPTDLDVRFPDRAGVNDTESLIAGLANLPSALSKQGFAALRPGQDVIINHILASRDTIGVLPTGQGKSACYITPALCHGYKTIIFSPLTALMADQVGKLLRLGLRAGAISGLYSDSINSITLEAWKSGELQFLLVAPERIANHQFENVVRHQRPDFVVIDEAHVVSQWSDNFRPSYKLIGDFIRELKPKVVLALTATCPDKVEQEIRHVFCLGDAVRLTHYPRRRNLVLNAETSAVSDGDVFSHAIEMAETRGQTLVYCASIKNVQHVTACLQSQTRMPVSMFYSTIGTSQKRDAMDGFMNSETKIMVCTNAFGMGIDHGSIRAVVHYDVTGSIENLAQEVGRAGRDGKESICTAFLRPKSMDTQRFFIMSGNANKTSTMRTYEWLKSECRKSKDGKVFATYADVGRLAGVKFGVEPAIQLLDSRCLIKKEAGSDKAKIRILAQDANPQFAAFTQALTVVSMFNGKAYEFTLDALAERMGLSVATVRNRVKSFVEKEVIDYTPAAMGTKFEIVPNGDIGMIDFEAIEAKTELAYKKLARVEKYCYLKSSDARHSFIEEEFGIKS